MDTITQRRTSAVQPEIIKPPGARNSVFDNGHANPTARPMKSEGEPGARRGGVRTRLPPLDEKTLEFKPLATPPAPKGGAGNTESKWGWLFGRLKADGNAWEGIPIVYRSALQKVAQRWHLRASETAQSRFVVRTADDGLTVGLYRLAAKGAPAARKAGKP